MKYWWIRLLRYSLPYRRGLLGLILLSAAGVALEVLKPWPMKLILDSVIAGRPLPAGASWLTRLPYGQSPTGLLLLLAIATLAIFVTSWAARAWQSYLQAGAGARMVYDLGLDLFYHLQQLSLRFHGKRPAGDLVQRVTSDSQCVRELVIQVLLPLVSSLMSLGAIIGILLSFDKGLALLALLAAPLIVLMIRIFDKPMTERSYKELQLRGEQMAHAEQTLSSLQVVRAFGGEPLEDARFSTLAHQTGRAYMRAILSQTQFKGATTAVTALATAVVMAYGGIRALEGSLSLGALVVCLSYLASIYAPMETIAYLYSGVASAAAGAGRVFEILEENDAVRNRPGARPLSRPAQGKITFEDVTFGYEPGRKVLDGIDLEVQPGETVALVGATGAGKSTLVSLIPRFFDPWSGRVTLDGVDLRDLEIASLRAEIAVVLQEPFLLPITIAQNIAYGQPHRPDDVVRAAVAAQAHEFIRQLPKGYDTIIAEKGVTLSGGQRQRLAIARALYRKTPILIMDEPTSALDVETETSLVATWERLRAGRSTIIIAHRLSTIESADRIVVLDHGKIIESGSHAALLAGSGAYRRFYEAQFGGAGMIASVSFQNAGSGHT